MVELILLCVLGVSLAINTVLGIKLNRQPLDLIIANNKLHFLTNVAVDWEIIKRGDEFVWLHLQTFLQNWNTERNSMQCDIDNYAKALLSDLETRKKIVN